MKNIEEYILLSREDRRKHLDLNSPCDKRGGSSKEFRGLLAHYLDTSIPRGRNFQLCHACHDGECSNVKHLYWGTFKDNHQDTMENGGDSFWIKSVKKHGIEEATRRRVSGLEKSRGCTAYTQEQITANLAILGKIEKKRGWKSKAAIALGISHTQVRRFCLKHAKELYGSVI